MGLPLNDKESLAGVFEIRARERAHFQRSRAVRTLAREALQGLSPKYIEEKSRGETDVYQGLKVPNSLILKIALDEAGRAIAKDPSLVVEKVINRLWNKASILAARKLLRQMNSQNGLVQRPFKNSTPLETDVKSSNNRVTGAQSLMK